MITKSGTKLLDFGLARLGVDSPTTAFSELHTQDKAKPLSTGEGVIIGTVEYMAPEQLAGTETDARTDIFAFGAVVYEMVTGKRAFTGETQASLIGAILKDEPGSMAKFLMPTPASLDHVIGRCLEKDPDQRWQTAADLMHELTWVREAEPAALRAPEPGAKRMLLAVTLATLAAGALITTIALRSFGPEPLGEVTRAILDVHEGAHLGDRAADNQATLGRPLRRAFALSPDGRNLVYVGNDGEDTQLYLHPLDQNQAVAIPGTEGAHVARFSPDGQSIAFFGAGGVLMRVPVDGGEARTISTTGIGFRRRGLSWTDDDRILLTSYEGVLQVPANGGVVTHLTTHDLGRPYVHAYPQLLPGGRAVLYAAGRSPGRVPSEEFNVIVESLETGVPIVVVEGGTDPAYLDSGHIVFVRSGTLMAVRFDAANLEVTGDPVVVLEDLMQAEGAGNTNQNHGTGQYSVSGSETLAYLPGSINPRGRMSQVGLNWVDMEGNAEPVPLPPGRYSGLRFSPDGTRLAYYEGDPGGTPRSTWVYDIDREIPARLPKYSIEHDNQTFAWSPDGTEIVFSSQIGDSPLNLYLTAADGSGTPKRLTESDADQQAAFWSSNGFLAFFEKRTDGPRVIMILQMDGDSEPEPFLETPLDALGPTFSPDGNWLAYTSNETGRREVYVRPFPAGEPAYQVSNGGEAPVWSPNGEQLFYRRSADRLWRFMVVDIPGGSISARSLPRMLLEGSYSSSVPMRNYDVSPDGDRFVLQTQVVLPPEPVTRINIVLNWFEELAELVPAP